MDKDNRQELKKRLATEYNLPQGDPIIEAMLEAAAICTDRGYAEMEPIREKYQDLVCPWCSKLHHREECLEQFRKYQDGTLPCPWCGEIHKNEACPALGPNKPNKENPDQ